MTEIDGEGWVGFLDPSNNQAAGKINGYSWLLQLKTCSWSFEIAEDQSIEREELPLVGFGCGGWLSEPMRESDHNTDTIKSILESQFKAFEKGKLTYYPSVSCTCSD